MTVHTTNHRSVAFNRGVRPLQSPSSSPPIKATAPRSVKDSVFGILARTSPKPRTLSGPMAFYEISEGAHSSCVICREDFTGLDLVMKVNRCGHILHDRCSEEWFARKTACVCQSDLSSTALGSSAPVSSPESPKPLMRERRFPSRKTVEDNIPPPPEPSPSPVSSPFTETSEYRLDSSPFGLHTGEFDMQRSLSADEDDTLHSIHAIQNQLFQMQRQLNRALANVQELTQKVQRIKHGRQGLNLRRSIEDFVITSFDGIPVRFDP